MKENLGVIEKVLRFIIGIVAAAAAAFAHLGAIWTAVLFVVALVLFATSFTGV